ncbi:MAG: Ada metal-binding domain-containing protein [Rhizobium sp.]|nr:Ada metal-binding domain-containing protein [Rhizobium sp.]MDM8014500.1 Ada metal-binding domain-containing protein [Rhizobium sp.]
MNPDLTEDDTRWQAVRTRDAAMDGHFVYGVLSTRIFCRPSCPSRPARPENVTFYETREAAREGGFRACLRCRPDKPETWAEPVDRRLTPGRSR